MILLIDNYDSFTHNLFQYLSEITTEEIRVIRNDRITVEGVVRLSPSHIIISPGPGRPENAGISVDLIKRFAGSVPILGVCLGHQAIGAAFGAPVVQARNIVHGKAQPVRHDGKGLFRALSSPALVTRYHSLAIRMEDLPGDFEVTATAPDGEIMGIRHKDWVLEGVQFHPESIASEEGKRMLANFLKYRREPFPRTELMNGITQGRSMSRDEAVEFMEEVTEGKLTAVQLAGFLVALNAKGIEPQEIAGCASVLQRKRIPINSRFELLDTCGTGGDELGTFNVSSMTALVAAACGAHVAKHGNRAVSSRSGSADFYRALGINVDITPKAAGALIDEHGFAFLFAPTYHGAMRHAGPARRELGVKTIMNLLGPLVNPAAADFQLIGVYSEALVPVMAEAAHLLGIRRGMVVHGTDGIDELSVSAESVYARFDEDGVHGIERLDPAGLGISGHSLQDLVGGTPEQNADLARELMDGSGRPAIRDSVALNAAAALNVAGLADSIEAGLEQAREALASGKVRAKLSEIVEASYDAGEAQR